MRKLFLTISLALIFSLSACGSEETTTKETTTEAKAEITTEATTEISGNENDKIIYDFSQGKAPSIIEPYVEYCLIYNNDISVEVKPEQADYFPFVCDYMTEYISGSENYKNCSLTVEVKNEDTTIQWETEDMKKGVLRGTGYDPMFDVTVKDIYAMLDGTYDSSEETESEKTTEGTAGATTGELNALESALSYLNFSNSINYMIRMFVSILILQWFRKG